MLAFGVVELQCGCQRVEHIGRRAAAATLLQSRVVVDTDAGQPGQFLASQTRHAPASRGAVQSHVLRGEPRTAHGEEFRQLGWPPITHVDSLPRYVRAVGA